MDTARYIVHRVVPDDAELATHRAYLDAQLLAEVYLAMTRGQETLIIDLYVPPRPAGRGFSIDGAAMDTARYIVHRVVPDDAELATHRAYLDALARESKAGCLWLSLETPVAIA